MAYGQSCSIQVQLGSAITFGLASTTAVLGGPETASFPYIGFLNFLQKFYCGISDSEFYSFLWVTELQKRKKRTYSASQGLCACRAPLTRLLARALLYST